MKNNRSADEVADATVKEESSQSEQQTNVQSEFKTVYILTYTPTNEVKASYVNSLATTIRFAMLNGIKVVPILIGGIDNPSMAKNELLNNLNGQDYHSAVFVGHDLAWDAVSFVQNLISKEEVVALPVVKKVLGNVVFDLDLDVENIEKNEEELIKVKYASLGFLKLSKRVVDELLDGSPSITNNTGNEVKNVFEYQVKDGQALSDSIVICNKIKEMNYDIWLNSNSTCAQLTDNLYAVDFASTVFPPAQEETQTTQTELPLENTTDEVKSLYE
jgi:hypothetical protein